MMIQYSCGQCVGMTVGVNVFVGVGVSVGVKVGVSVGTGVSVGIGVTVGKGVSVGGGGRISTVAGMGVCVRRTGIRVSVAGACVGCSVNRACATRVFTFSATRVASGVSGLGFILSWFGRP